MGAAWGGAELIEGWGVRGRGRKWAGPKGLRGGAKGVEGGVKEWGRGQMGWGQKEAGLRGSVVTARSGHQGA